VLVAAIVRYIGLKETLEHTEEVKLSELKDAFRYSIGEIIRAWKLMPKSLIFLVAYGAIGSILTPIIITFSPLYVCDFLGISEIGWGTIHTASLILMLASGLLIGKIVDIIGRKISLIISRVLFIPSIIGFAFSEGFLSLLITFVIVMLAASISHPAYSALEADLVPKDKRGRILGSARVLYYSASIPGPIIGGFLYESVSPRIPFILCGLMSIFSLPILLFLVKEPRKKEV
jgi:MFS family permease